MSNFKKHFPFIASGFIILVAGGFLALWFMAYAGQAEKNDDTLQDYGPVSDFNFIERSNSPMGRTDLLGKVWVADFIFTTCAGPCPIMSQKMSQLQTAISHAEDVKLVSISVDPERDTPEVLSRYAEHYDAKPDKWYFLTGDRKAIYDFAIKSLKLSVREEDNQIIHSTMFVLVDKKGQIRGYYNTSKPEYLSTLAVDIERLRQEGASAV